MAISHSTYRKTLIEKVFNNQYLIEKILNHLPGDLMRNLDIRRTNKAFNNSCLTIIRKKNRKMKIEFIGKQCSDITQNRIFINYQSVKITEMDGYFKFLNNVADVKVEKIELKNLWKLNDSYHKQIHDSIISKLIGNNRGYLKTLLGMDDICFMCKDCVDLAERCREYGPIEFVVFRNIKNPCHFKKLIIGDNLFDTIANNSIAVSQSKEGCFKELNQIINSNISCDQLVLQISESRQILPRENDHCERDHTPIPREIIELMIKKWNVKSIGLKFKLETINAYCFYHWSKSQYFTPIRFSDPYGSVEKSTEFLKKFIRVDVDLTDSYYCSKDLILNSQECMELTRGYENLIATIRRVFPTDKISIIFSHWYNNSYGTISTVFNSIINVVTKDDHSNLTVDFKYFPPIDTFKDKNEKFIELSQYQGFDFSIQDPFLHRFHRTLEGTTSYSSQFSMDKLIGKRITAMDNRIECQINFYIFINENDYYELPETLIRKHPNSFVNHFIPPFLF